MRDCLVTFLQVYLCYRTPQRSNATNEPRATATLWHEMVGASAPFVCWAARSLNPPQHIWEGFQVKPGFLDHGVNKRVLFVFGFRPPRSLN